MEFKLRGATEADWGFLVDLRRATMGPHLARVGVEYDEEAQARRVRHRYECAQIVVVEGEDVGVLKVDKGEAPWTLLRVQLLPEYQGRGAGTALVKKVLAEAGEAGVGVELGVLKGNPAKGLYERLGFVVVGEGERGFEMLWTGTG